MKVKFIFCHFFKGKGSVLKDCCLIEDNTFLPPDTIVPPFTVFSGSPAKHTENLPDITSNLMIDYTKSIYHHFIMLKITSKKSKAAV